MPAHLEHAARESYGQNFAFRVHHRMATATGSTGGMCGECVAAPTQQEGMLDTHDTGLTGNPNLGGRPHQLESKLYRHPHTRI